MKAKINQIILKTLLSQSSFLGNESDSNKIFILSGKKSVLSSIDLVYFLTDLEGELHKVFDLKIELLSMKNFTVDPDYLQDTDKLTAFLFKLFNERTNVF